MKKCAVLLLILCLLGGCTAPPADREPAENTPPPAAEPAPEEPCGYTVETVERECEARDDDSALLATYRAALPVLVPCRSNGVGVTAETAATDAERRALAAAETFNAQFASWKDAEPVSELAETAREDRSWRQEAGIGDFSEYSMELDCRVYQTERLVSVAGDYYSYTGGAHPNTVLMAWNFDLETGEFFAPEQLAEDAEAFSRTVREEIVRQIGRRAEESGLAPEEMFWSNYEEIAAGWSSYAVSFDGTGMTVGFSPYELAAYAAGPQVFHLPCGLLAPCLSDYGRAVLGLAE